MRKLFTLFVLSLLLSTIAFGQKTLKNHEKNSEKRRKTFFNNTGFQKKSLLREQQLQKINVDYNSAFVKSAAAKKQMLDSLIELVWDSNSSQWYANWKETFTYNANGKVAGHIYYQKYEINGQWFINWKAEYTYDDNGNPTLELDYIWDEDAGEWINAVKRESTFDANGNVLMEIDYELDELSDQLIAVWKEEYTYGDYGITQYVYYERDENNGQLVALWKEVYSYDSNNNISQFLEYSRDENSSEWVNDWKGELTYNSGGNYTMYIYSVWDETSSKWYPYSKSEFSYDENGNMTEVIDFETDFLTSLFVKTAKSAYEYDANGNPTIEIYSDYDDESETFIFDSKYDYTYDLSVVVNDLILPSLYLFTPDFSNQIVNKPTEFTSYDWDYGIEEWGNSYKSIYYYTEGNSTGVNDLGNNISKIYPNPVAKYLMFSIAGNNTNATFELFDLQGQKLLSKEVNSNERINLKNMDTGMYIYRINVDGNKQTGKLIKE